MAVVKLDRPAQTTGNIVHFEHVNVTVPDPQHRDHLLAHGHGVHP